MFSDYDLLFVNSHAKRYSLAPSNDPGVALGLADDFGRYHADKRNHDPRHQIILPGNYSQSSATLGHRNALEAYQIDVAN